MDARPSANVSQGVVMAKSWAIEAAACLWLVLATAPTLHAQARPVAPLPGERENLAGVDVLGRSIVYSFTYETIAPNGVGLAAGVGWLGSGNGSSIVFLPVAGSWRPARRARRPYFAVGATVVASSAYEALDTDLHGVLAHVTLGYEITTRDGNLIRPTLTYLIGREIKLVWPGVLFARRF